MVKDKNSSLTTQQDIIELIAADPWMMKILRAARALQLPDWWVAAGFVRSKVWDTLHGYTERSPLPDIDVIYFDPTDPGNQEGQITQHLELLIPDLRWEVTNQARVHTYNQEARYHSSADALSRWVETATCIGIRLHEDDQLELCAPHGIDDLVNMIVRINPHFSRNPKMYRERQAKKNWQATWPRLQIKY